MAVRFFMFTLRMSYLSVDVNLSLVYDGCNPLIYELSVDLT